MRPDDYAEVDSERWTEALVLRNAWEEGRQGANEEGQMQDWINQVAAPE